MNLFAEGGPWLTILFFSVLFLVIFRRPLGWLLKLLARSALGLGFLALWSQSGLAAGLALGQQNDRVEKSHEQRSVDQGAAVQLHRTVTAHHPPLLRQGR